MSIPESSSAVSGEVVPSNFATCQSAPPERIAQTFEWSGMPGYVSVDIAEFEDLGDRTLVRTRSLFHLPEERDGMLEAGMESGLRESLERLDEVLERLM